MTNKTLNKVLEIAVYFLAGGLITLILVLFVLDIKETRATNSKLDSIEQRVTSLEQDLKNTKEVLDAKGFTDLNF